MIKKRVQIIVDGIKISKHPRDFSKDNVIRKSIPNKKCKILEVSAGAALFAKELRQDKHDVTITNFAKSGINNIKEFQLDLNDYEYDLGEQKYDVILLREVLEHVENIPHTLRNLKKYLASDGVIILTIPNRISIRSRFYYFLSGFYRGMPSYINLEHRMGEEHINLVGYPELDYFLRKTGFNVKSVESSQIENTDKVWLIFKPLIWATTSFFLLFHKKNRQGYEKNTPKQLKINKFVRDVLMSTDLCCGKDIVVAAEVAN